MKAVLVTGGAGYIGSHTAKVLAKARYLPVTIDNLSSGHRWAVKYGPLVEADITDRTAIRHTVARFGIEDAIHFAAKAYVGESMVIPRKYFHQNVSSSIQLVDDLMDAGVRRIIFSSTCATYGVPKRLPIQETQPQLPLSPYGESKLFVERMLRWYGNAYGLKSVSLRYFNAAGADPEGELGEDHDPETHLIPSAIEAAVGERTSLEVFGSDYATSDGTAVRDFTHVSDLARAHVLALEYLQRGGESAAYNLGTGQGYSVQEVIRAVEMATQLPVPVSERPRRPGDAAMLVADAAKAGRELGWKAEYRDLQSIVQTAWRWHSRANRQQAATA